MKSVIVLLAATLALAGCAPSPEAAKVRRDQLIAQVFPDPADRQGIDLAFPLESGGVYSTVEIGYFSDELGPQDVALRVSDFCKRQAPGRHTGQVAIRKDLGSGMRTMPDGRSRPVRSMIYTCVRAS